MLSTTRLYVSNMSFYLHTLNCDATALVCRVGLPSYIRQESFYTAEKAKVGFRGRLETKPSQFVILKGTTNSEGSGYSNAVPPPKSLKWVAI
jgi:hypothetical protein